MFRLPTKISKLPLSLGQGYVIASTQIIGM